MKGPMKGATIAHAKQRYYNGSYIGITEPGIIASESPNPIVNTLVVMPDRKTFRSFCSYRSWVCCISRWCRDNRGNLIFTWYSDASEKY